MSSHKESPLKEIFTHGDLSLKGQFILGSNYTFLVTVHHEGQDYPAVYKPSRTRGFEFFLLPSRVHARPSAMLRERKPLGGKAYVPPVLKISRMDSQ